jgi:hypothetical protein
MLQLRVVSPKKHDGPNDWTQGEATMASYDMTWHPATNFALGAALIAVGVIAAILQYWLWTFPMSPDPTGRDPNGVTSAPKFWRYTHRVLGYVFVLIYLMLAVQMVPRIWRFDEAAWTPTAIAHAATGLAILPILISKVAILRLWKKHGKKLPLFGSGLAILALASLGLVAPKYLKVASGPEPGKSLVGERCYSCHAASRILSKDGDGRDWLNVLEDMTENAEEMRRPDPVRNDAQTFAEYLSRIRPNN